MCCSLSIAHEHRREMISLVLRQAQDEENHQTDGEENHLAGGGANRLSSGLILSLSKDADALTQTYPQGGGGLCNGQNRNLGVAG
jgi:hypothetical protein